MDYGEAYRTMHETDKRFPGYSLSDYVRPIVQLVEQHRPQRLLDYGCGKGFQYLARRHHDAWGGLLPHCYDIGVPQLSRKPEGQFGGVICTDMLEHIAPADVPAILDDLIGYVESGGFLFLAISCRPANKKLPKAFGGANAHLTIEPPGWWVRQIVRRLNGLGRGDLKVVAEFDLGEPPHFANVEATRWENG